MALAGWNRWVLVSLLTAGTAVAAMPEGQKAVSAQLLEQVEHWHAQAETGDANALFNLGQYFRRGIGIQPDPQRARGYYQQAAELGHAGAQLNLGTLYYFAPDKPNLEQVLYWWGKAAHQGEPQAQYQLAVLSLKLPQPQLLDALAWMTLARDNGHPQAEKALQQLKSSVPAAIQAGLAPRLAELRSGAQAPSPVDAQASAPEPRAVPTAPQSEAKEVESATKDAADAAASPTVVPEVQSEPARSEPEAESAIAWADALYTVQLASLTDEASAQAMMQQLVQRHAAVLADHPIRVLAARLQGKDIYRVQAGAFATRAKARLLCKALQDGGQGCFPSRLR